MTIEEQQKEFERQIDCINEKVKSAQKLDLLETEMFCTIQSTEKGFSNLPLIYCADYKFSTLYKTYSTDLTFNSNEFYKIEKPTTGVDMMEVYRILRVHNSKPFNQDRHNSIGDYLKQLGVYKLITKKEILQDKLILFEFAKEWEDVISKENHPDQRLQKISKEARDGRKKILKLYENGELSENKKNHELNLNLWKTIYIYIEACKIVEHIEKESTFPLTLQLKEHSVSYNFYTIIHVFNRHFAKMVSSTKILGEKSFHSPIFEPLELHSTLKNIFLEFNKCQRISKSDVDHNKAINFIYKGVKYQLYFKRLPESTNLFQISSLYPIEQSHEIEKLVNFELVELNSDLSIYIKL